MSDRKPPLEGVAAVRKPLTTDCNCHPDWLHVGRYGRWTKGVLSHDAYFATMARLQAGVQEALDVV